MTDIKKQEPFIEYFEELHKAIDCATWLTFVHRVKKEKFGVLNGPENNYAVVSEETAKEMEMEFQYPAVEDYSGINYEKIKRIGTDIEPLGHWEALSGAFSVMDGELLRFILKYNVPLKRFIRYELASRGYDEKHKWIGFEKAKEIWLK